MLEMYKAIAAYPFAYLGYLFIDGGTTASFDITALLDRYGFPTAILAVVLWFVWNRQKAADRERNDLIGRNNELTEQLIEAVERGNQCMYSIEREQHKTGG